MGFDTNGVLFEDDILRIVVCFETKGGRLKLNFKAENHGSSSRLRDLDLDLRWPGDEERSDGGVSFASHSTVEIAPGKSQAFSFDIQQPVRLYIRSPIAELRYDAGDCTQKNIKFRFPLPITRWFLNKHGFASAGVSL